MTLREGLPYLLLPAVFVLDLLTPLGIADGMLYAIVLVYACFFGIRDRSILLAGLITMLVVVGYLLSGDGADPVTAIVNRAYSLILVWSIALVTASTSVIADIHLPQLRHDLRSPINTIDGGLESMLSGACGRCDSTESREHLLTIRAAAHDLKVTSERLLDVIANRLPSFARGLADQSRS